MIDRHFPNIKVNASIESKKLIYDEDFSEKSDWIVYASFFIAPIFFLYVNFISSPKNLNSNEIFFNILMSLAMLVIFTFNLILIIKKLNENKLKTFTTKFNIEENNEVIHKMATANGWSKWYNSERHLVYISDEGNFKYYIYFFFFKNSSIYYTILTQRFKLNYPTILGISELKKELSKNFQ